MSKSQDLQDKKVEEEIKTIQFNRKMDVIKSIFYGVATSVAAYVAINGLGN